MSVLSPDTRAEILRARIHAGGLLVACLCAQWCSACRSYRATFAELAARWPQHGFAWLDVEEHAEALGHLDIENFPTLLIQRGQAPGEVLFFGPVPPHASVIDRLLSHDLDPAHAPPEAPDLLGWLLRVK